MSTLRVAAADVAVGQVVNHAEGPEALRLGLRTVTAVEDTGNGWVTLTLDNGVRWTPRATATVQVQA